MKISPNNSLNINLSQSEFGGFTFETNSTNNDKKKNSIFVGDNSIGNTEAFNLKKQKARKDAMKIVMDAYDGDKLVSDGIDSRKERVNEIYGEISEYADNVKRLEDNKEQLKESYNLTDEMIENGDVPDEYKEDVRNIDKELNQWNALINKGKNEACSNNKAIECIKIESCKQHNMIDATKQADVIMDEARQEIIDTVKDKAVESIDDKIEEKVEEGKEAAEEKKEEEERIEEKTEDKEQKRLQEDSRDIIDADTKVNVGKILDDLKDKMQLLDEDIKGINVDTQL